MYISNLSIHTKVLRFLLYPYYTKGFNDLP
nr:MAG TPA: hypothetical protein [Caudoviricetes sp.]